MRERERERERGKKGGGQRERERERNEIYLHFGELCRRDVIPMLEEEVVALSKTREFGCQLLPLHLHLTLSPSH